MKAITICQPYAELIAQAIKQAFVAGWKIGYCDGHEHECRMFPPTAERAWDDYQHEQKGQVKEPR